MDWMIEEAKRTLIYKEKLKVDKFQKQAQWYPDRTEKPIE